MIDQPYWKFNARSVDLSFCLLVAFHLVDMSSFQVLRPHLYRETNTSHSEMISSRIESASLRLAIAEFQIVGEKMLPLFAVLSSVLCFEFIFSATPVADLRVAQGMCSPPGSKFIQFHAAFGKFWQNHMLAPPGELAAPHQGNPGSTTVYTSATLYAIRPLQCKSPFFEYVAPFLDVNWNFLMST